MQLWNLSDFIIKNHGEEHGSDLGGDDEIDEEGFEIIKDECDREGKEAVIIITRKKVSARDTQFWTS